VTVVDPSADLTITVTPFSGDPDIYVGIQDNYHPNKVIRPLCPPLIKFNWKADPIQINFNLTSLILRRTSHGRHEGLVLIV